MLKSVRFSFLSLLKLSLIIIISVFFCSCSKREDRTLKFWHFWSEPNQAKLIKEIVAEFEKENNCKIEITELSWNDGKTKLMAAFNSRTAPDVLELGSDWVAQFSSSGVLLPLSKDSMKIDNYIDFSKAPAFWANKLYAIPWTVDTRVLFYNKDLLQKAGITNLPPKTIADMQLYADKVNNPGVCYGFGANGSDPHRLYKKILNFIWSCGGNVIDNNGMPTLNSTQNAHALQLYINLARSGYIETQRQIDADFVQGKVALLISGSWLLEKIKHENPKLNYGTGLMPSCSNTPGVSFAGGEYLSINANSTHQALAKKFIEYMTNGETVIKFCSQVAEAGFPADKGFFNKPFYDASSNKATFAEQLKHAMMTPVHQKWLDIEALLENAVVEALYARKSPQQALNDAQSSAMYLAKSK